MKIKDKNAALYLHLLFALEDRNLTYISGVFISNVLDALRILEDKNELLVKDIRRGSINRNLNIDYETRKNLVKKFYKALEPGGYLFVGHAETIERGNSGFKYVMPSVYRKE